MTQITRRLLIALGALAGVAALVSFASAATVKHIRTGYYEAGIVGMNGGYQIGAWDVTKTHGEYAMTVDSMYDGIYYPDSDKCGGSVPLTKTEIPLSKHFSFAVRDEEDVTLPNGDAATQKVKWNGHWVTSHSVEGKITITVGNCTDKRKWGGGI
jgi:hypothetical protein